VIVTIITLYRDDEFEQGQPTHYIGAVKGKLTAAERKELAERLDLGINDDGLPDEISFCEVEVAETIDALSDLKVNDSEGCIRAVPLTKSDDDELR
jgi:hypothetical protein